VNLDVRMEVIFDFDLFIIKALKFLRKKLIFILYSTKEKPKKIAGKEKKVAQNGCGAYDYHFDFDLIKLSGFNDCCNEHDICYGTCNTPKIECDNQFKECLFARCVKLAQKNTLIKSYEDICKEAAQVLYASVMKLGCPAYGKAQKQECVC